MPRFPDNLTNERRIEIAQQRADRFIDHVRDLASVHEANKIVVYSKALSSQVPQSHAASAFNQMQRSMLMFELVRLCAMWDPCREDRESAPTIADLIDKPEIIRKIVDDRHSRYANEPEPFDCSPTSDPLIQKAQDEWWEKDRQERADFEANRTREQLTEALDRIAKMRASPILKSMRDFRDENIAHNLDPNRSSAGGQRPRYGDERPLLRETVKVADLLHRGLNDTHFFWLDARRQARRDARALWLRCRFDIDPNE
ncbi:hypothetical protein MKK50_17975 [Methylobacterium sp. J-043]|nr:hypothetical protein [Methylobacterium sp. J-043]